MVDHDSLPTKWAGCRWSTDRNGGEMTTAKSGHSDAEVLF